MKIAVLIKQVPDTETKIRIKQDGTGIEELDIKYVISPYDEFAIEEAIKTKEKAGGGETFVVSLGPDRVTESLRTALAMGIDKGIHIHHDGVALDSTTTALALSEAIKDKDFDIIFCGKQAIDADNGQVAQMVAEFLDIPQVMIIEKIELNPDKKGVLATRRVSGGAREIYDVSFPALFGCEKGLNTPRFASLPGIMKAKSKPIEKLKSADLLGETKPLVKFVNYQFPPERQGGIKIEGEPEYKAKELVRLLREEAKVI